MERKSTQLLVVSNRLPVAVTQEDGQWKARPSSGGLVTALAPLMRKNRGLWIGWPGCDAGAPVDELMSQASEEQGFDLKAIDLSEDEVARYYRGFSNETLWPLFHDLLGFCRFEEANWETYVEINRRFAEILATQISEASFVWVHDYQLMLVGHFLREMGVEHKTNFFLHIPFPSADLYRRLPWRQELIEGLLQYDHVGFQTANDRRNFVQCIRSLVPDARARAQRRQSTVRWGGRQIRLGSYPISIDFEEFANGAQSHEVADAAWYIHENLPGRVLVLGLDRLDYTKGIPERFLAFERFLEKYPETRGKVSLLQILVPSRTKVPEYQSLKGRLDTLVGHINSRFTQHGWVPIHYLFRHLDRSQLLGHYRACEIALITPLRDGMNLVAKEYCAASVENNGILILSEFAGAAPQLSKGALVVNPYDIEQTADAIYRAYVMSPESRARRMKLLRGEIRRNDVHRWVEWFLGTADVPRVDDSQPVPLPGLDQ